MERSTLLMPLLDEGVDAWRPVMAERLTDGTYRIRGPVPEGEVRAFASGSRIAAQVRLFDGGQHLVATDLEPED